MRNHASGGVSVSAPRSQGRRHSTAPGWRTDTALTATGRYPRICVQACCHWVNEAQLFFPFPHAGSGVFQNLIDVK